MVDFRAKEDVDLVASEPSPISLHRLATSEDEPSAAVEPSTTVPLTEDDDDVVPSAVPEPLSITVPLYRLEATYTPEGAHDDFVSSVPVPSSTTFPLYRYTAAADDEDNSVPSAVPEPLSITVPLHKLPATAEDDDFVPSPVAPESPPVIIRDGSPETSPSRSRSSSRRRRRDEAPPNKVAIERPQSPPMPPVAAVPTFQPGLLPGVIPGGIMPGTLSAPPTPSVSAVTERDLNQDLGRLADEIRTYDRARGLEHRGLVDDVRELRDELQGLAAYLRRTPFPAVHDSHRAPPRPSTPETPPHRIERVDRPIEGISLVYPHEIPPGSGLTRSMSNASSVISYLSSHYSDEGLLEAEPESSLQSPTVWEEEPSVGSSPHNTSPSSVSSNPLTRSTELEATIATPQAPDVFESASQDIRDHLRALEDQNAARDLLEGLQTRPEGHTEGHAERIKNLIKALMDPGSLETGTPETPQVVSPARTASTPDSTDALRRFRPKAARAGPSVAQLDDIPSWIQLPQPTPSQLPDVEPSVYRPIESGRGERSVSPTSIELPPGSQTVPSFDPISQARSPGKLTRRELSKSVAAAPLTAAGNITPLPPRQRPSPGDHGRGEPRGGEFNVGAGPTPRSTFGEVPRLATAPADIGSPERVPDSWYRWPPDIGGPERVPDSWYRQPQQPKLSTRVAYAPLPDEPPAVPAGVHSMPMPAGLTAVQLPPLFDSLMEILRENHLAQLTTVDQQRELMRYMKGLNEWLERDVHDRQNNLRDLYARVEQISRDIRGIRARERRPKPPSSPSTEESETDIRYNFPTAPPDTPGFQPYHVDRPVIPDVRTSPVNPQLQPTTIMQPAGGVIPGRVPPIPRPPSRASTGSPRPSIPVPIPYLSKGAGQTIVHRPYSPPSSEDASTDRSARRRSRSRERGRHYDSRRSSISPRRTPPISSRRSPSISGTAPLGQPIVLVHEIITSESPRSECRRSRSRSSERIVQPGMPTVSSAAQGPHIVPSIPEAPKFPVVGPPVVMHPQSRSRSHSFSPNRRPSPVILQPQRPLPSDRRYRSPSSYSPEHHRRHRSPRYSSYSPERRRHRSPSSYDRDDRRRDRYRYRRRSHSYYSRSPPPRRGRRSSDSRSRTPPIHPSPPTVITGPPPTYYSRTYPPPTHYKPVHRSPHIPGIDSPPSVPAAALIPEKPANEAMEIESAAQRVASGRASGVMKLEKGEFALAGKRGDLAKGRKAQLLDQLWEEKDRVITEKDHKIKALEDELRLRDLDNERQQQFAEKANPRERERQEWIVHDNEMRTQLVDVFFSFLFLFCFYCMV